MAVKKKVEFGCYPQNLVTDEAIVGALGGFDESWKSYGYVLGTIEEKKVPWFVDFMYFIDKVYKCKKYRGVYFTSYRTDAPIIDSRPINSRQPKNGYMINTVYWFEYAPIQWDVLKSGAEGNLMISTKVLDSQEFYFYSDYSQLREHKDYQGHRREVYDNNYQFSNLRNWLNTTFVQTAFTPAERSKLLVTSQDNGLESTCRTQNIYLCETTRDKVFALSSLEVTTYIPEPKERLKEATDYAKCQSLWMMGKRCAQWWLRSPHHSYGATAQVVFYDGTVDNGSTFAATTGVVPAIVVK